MQEMLHNHGSFSLWGICRNPDIVEKILDTIGRNGGGGAQPEKRRLMISLRKSTFIPVNPYVHRSAGPQEEGALMCSKGTNLGPAQQSSAGLLHFERWEHAK